MELASLHTNQATAKTEATVKTFKHFTLNSYQDKVTAPQGKTDFFYVGKNSPKVDFLIKTFEGGCTAESIENAIFILKRLSQKDNTPDIIIIDAKCGVAGLKQLHSYLSANASFSLVPFVLEASDLTENELEKYRKFDFLDEIIFLGEKNTEKLMAKVEFLKKVKMHPYHYVSRKNIQTSIRYQPKNIGKRTFDIIGSLFAILILSPVFLLIALLIKLESRGPVLYVAPRAGRGYRIFNFYKFRTMILDADKKVDQLSHLNQYSANAENLPVFFKIPNDPRITKVGAFLRNTSLDELPQFFNVLFGDMSLVGNRPLPLYEAAALTTDEWADRFMAPAGITGLWQIKKNGKDGMSVEERIRLDIAYAQKYNFMYDLWIMANTPSALIQKSHT